MGCPFAQAQALRLIAPTAQVESGLLSGVNARKRSSRESGPEVVPYHSGVGEILPEAPEFESFAGVVQAIVP